MIIDIIKNIYKIKTELEEHARKLKMGAQLATQEVQTVIRQTEQKHDNGLKSQTHSGWAGSVRLKWFRRKPNRQGGFISTKTGFLLHFNLIPSL